jgi:hypothetical protein
MTRPAPTPAAHPVTVLDLLAAFNHSEGGQFGHELIVADRFMADLALEGISRYTVDEMVATVAATQNRDFARHAEMVERHVGEPEGELWDAVVQHRLARSTAAFTLGVALGLRLAGR